MIKVLALVALLQRNGFYKKFSIKVRFTPWRQLHRKNPSTWKVCSTFQKCNWFYSSYFKPSLYIDGFETHFYFALECSKKSYFLRKVPFLLIFRSSFTEHVSCCFCFGHLSHSNSNLNLAQMTWSFQ